VVAVVVGAMGNGGFRAIAAPLGRVFVALAFLLDPAILELLIRSRRVRAPVSPVLLVLLLALAGGALYLWARRDPPD